MASRIGSLHPTGLRAAGISPTALHHPAERSSPHPERSRNLEATFHSPTATTPLLALPQRGQHSRSTSSVPHRPSAEIRSTRISQTAILDYGLSDQRPDARYLNVRTMHPQVDSAVAPLREIPSGSKHPAEPSYSWLTIGSVRSPFAGLQLTFIRLIIVCFGLCAHLSEFLYRFNLVQLNLRNPAKFQIFSSRLHFTYFVTAAASPASGL
jgi:hypothetical protein